MISDTSAATRILEKFKTDIASLSGINSGPESLLARDAVAAQLPTVRQLIVAADPTIDMSWVQFPIASSHFRTGARSAAAGAIGAIRDAEELQRIIGPQSPKLAATGLHPVVWSAAAKLWDNGHRAAAVQRAATAVIDLVKDLTSIRDLGDKDLMSQVFSDEPPKRARPRLRWPGDHKDQTVISMRTGLRSLAAGMVQTVRNPTTHLLTELNHDEALEMIAALSMLARMIESCTLVAEIGADPAAKN